MVVKKTAIQAYLNRELDDFSWIKDCTTEELWQAVDDLPVKPDFHTKPFNHQLACFLIAQYCPQLLTFVDPGLGKTWIVLNTIKYRKKLGEPHKALAIVPFSAAVRSWVDQVEEHTPDLSVCMLKESGDKVDELLNGQHDVYVTTYAGLARLMCGVTGTQKGKWKIKDNIAKKVKTTFGVFAMDESHNLANKQSLYWRCCDRIAANTEVAFGMTGSPFGKNPEALWPQFYLVDRGETLGPTLGFFREVFCTSKRSFWGYWEYKFNQRMKGQLYRVIKNRSIVYEDHECGDVPKSHNIIRYVDMPESTRRMYDVVYEEFLENAKEGDKRLIQSSFIRMRQIASGFLYFKDDQGNRSQMVFPENPKLEILQEVIEGLPEKSKIIVFYEYIFTGQMISKHLTKMKIKHCILGGGQSDGDMQVKRFQTDPKYRVIAINNKAGGSSLNLQVADRVFYFETPTDPKDRKQTAKRIDRIGQKAKRIYYYDVVMRGTNDKAILESIKNGQDLYKQIILGKRDVK